MAREQQAAPHIRARTGEVGTDVTLRVDVLCMEQRWGEALALVQPPARCQPNTLRTLARNLGKEHQAQRIALLRRVLAQAMLTARRALERVQAGAWMDESPRAGGAGGDWKQETEHEELLGEVLACGHQV